MKIWVVGDLHGHFYQWIRLYQKMLRRGFSPRKDILIFLGDYVDGGYETNKLLKWLINHKTKYPHWQMLYGNHEDLMLDALVFNGRIYNSFDLWFRQGGKETYESYMSPSLTQYEKAISQIKDHIPFEHLDWLRQLPIYYETSDYFFVHAGVLPNFTLEQHKQGLEGKDMEWWKGHMIWIRDEFICSEYNWGKKIIFGHTCFRDPFMSSNKIGLDGMFHNEGKLFALELPSGKIHFEQAY